MKDQFALKDSILSIVTQEINDLTFLNQNLQRASRRINDTEGQLSNNIQSRIFDAYRGRH